MLSCQAYILHSRPYKETSALVDIFTTHGRQRAVLRGARSKRGSSARPFVLLELQLRGRGELKTIASLEVAGSYHLLQGERLFCAMYLNELLMRLLPLADAQPELFAHYELTLHALAQDMQLEPLLRTFEWVLLEQLGYGFSLSHDIGGLPLQPQQWYGLQPESGLSALAQMQPGAFLGADLLALVQTRWQDKQVLQTAKRLMRQALAPHLGSRPLMSRELFLGTKGA